jgi:chromate transporter
MKDKTIYFKLFTSVLYLSAFTFGGGYVIVPIMKKKFVEDLKILTDEEMLNLVAIGQSSPGAIAVNTALLAGQKTAGGLGAVLCVFAAVLPPLVTITVISFFYEMLKGNTAAGFVLKGMQAGVAVVVLSAVLDFAGGIFKEKKIIGIAVMAAAFALNFFLGVKVYYIILASLLCGIIYGIHKRAA